MVIMNFWTVGAGMVIFLAGLQGVPRHLLESAMIDGAGAWQRFLHVTFPVLLPTTFFMVIINTIGSFQIFTQAFLMTHGTGAPEDSLLFFVFYLFRQGFEYFDMGYASALALVLFLVIIVVTFIQFKIARSMGYEDTLN
jgi:multiple sugar transport system permease protein